MQNKLLADKYPIHVLELGKDETDHVHLDDLLKAIEARAAAGAARRPTLKLQRRPPWPWGFPPYGFPPYGLPPP